MLFRFFFAFGWNIPLAPSQGGDFLVGKTRVAGEYDGWQESCHPLLFDAQHVILR